MHMRQGEKAKIKMKKSMAFGRKAEQERLRWPIGFEDAESEQGKKLRSKGVIYEVKLNSWVARQNLDGENSAPKFLKTFLKKADAKEWEKPEGIDEILVNLKVYVSEDNILFQKTDWDIKANDTSIPTTISKVINSLKRGEHSRVEVSSTAYQLDPLLLSDFIPKLADYTDCPTLIVEAELLRLIKVDDWFKDGGSVLKRTFRKGKGG